jgi:lysophospholipase L1-like esterase
MMKILRPFATLCNISTAGGVKSLGYITLNEESIAATHPDLGIEIIGAGVSGNKFPNRQARLEKDVISKKPTIVFIYIGINDVGTRRRYSRIKISTIKTRLSTRSSNSGKLPN